MDLSKTVVLLDLSSFIFYRFFAVHKWLSISGKAAEYTPEMVLDKFAALFESNLKEIKRKLKVDWTNIFLVRDCPRDKIWRTTLYPDYKKTRDDKRSPLFDPMVFTRAYNELVPKLEKNFNLKVFQYDHAEADDVIAVMNNEIHRLHPQTLVYIMSADSDFLQLQSEHTNIINFQYKPLASTIKSSGVLENYLMWKIIKGDASDNIPAIDKKIGDVTALKLAKCPISLEQRLSASEQTRSNFERNQTLIDFNFIPQPIREGIIQMMH